MKNYFYNIKDLRVVMIDKNYIENKENEYVNYFNPDVKFIVEKTIIQSTNKIKESYYAEYYTECITEQDLSFRESKYPFEDNPKIFSLVSRIPFKYLTKEEIDEGKISVIRIYKVLQDMNVKVEKEDNKVKKIGTK